MARLPTLNSLVHTINRTNFSSSLSYFPCSANTLSVKMFKTSHSNISNISIHPLLDYIPLSICPCRTVKLLRGQLPGRPRLQRWTHPAVLLHSSWRPWQTPAGLWQSSLQCFGRFDEPKIAQLPINISFKLIGNRLLLKFLIFALPSFYIILSHNNRKDIS